MRNIVLCFVFLCILLISCKEDKGRNAKIFNKEKRIFYLINLPDTIVSGTPIIFEIKLIYPTTAKKEEFFSHLILSDSVDLTLNNILEKADNPYEIMELETNHWKVRRTFYKKGNFTVKGGIYVHTLEFKYPKNDSIKVYEKEDLIQIERKVYVK